MNLIKQKNKKLEKQLRDIDPKVLKSLLERYNRYCEDQYLFKFLSYRKNLISQNMNQREMIAFRMRINNRRNYELSKLCPPDDPKFNADRMGKHVEFLPPCLDPDAKKEDQERIAK